MTPLGVASACDPPVVPQVPDGTRSTLEEMLAAQDKVLAFQTANEAFLECVDSQMSVAQASMDKGDKTARERYALLAADYNAAVSREERVAFEFNSAIADYRDASPSRPGERQTHSGSSTREPNHASVTETYNIDLLEIRHTYRKGASCASGFINRFDLKGVIGPDSTFSMTRLLERYPPCRNASGLIIKPSIIALNSGGGLLKDGYALGRELRRLGVSAIVEPNGTCASSCAVAFLGGKRRIVNNGGTVMFHAPYFNGENAYGRRDISCDVGEQALDNLNSYYQEMTDTETGDRLFERTMWYCSANDGWVVQGASAAELYGIATEK